MYVCKRFLNIGEMRDESCNPLWANLLSCVMWNVELILSNNKHQVFDSDKEHDNTIACIRYRVNNMDDLDPFAQLGFASTKKQASVGLQTSSQLPLNAILASQTAQNDYVHHNTYPTSTYNNAPQSTLRTSPIMHQSWDAPRGVKCDRP